MHLELENLRDGYVTVAQEVMRRGKKASPRGEETTEVLDATLVVADPRDLLPVGTGRKVNVGVAALEALQCCGGYSDAAALRRASPAMEAFEDQGTYWGAYGPRIRAQLPAAVRRLQQDRESRRAYVSVWDPARDLHVEGVKNYPCTVAFQLLIREDRLLMQVNMRANDVWRGLSGDAFCWGQVQLTVATCLGIEPGEYRHHANSLHVYAIHYDQVESLASPATAPAVSVPAGFGSVGVTVEAAMARARLVGDGKPLPSSDVTESETWFVEKTEKYRSPDPAVPGPGGPG